MLFDFVVPWNGLTDLRFRVLIPVVLATVPNEHRTLLLDGANQVTALYAISSSACWRTAGIAPEERSL
jgi:hypothetical protein